MCNNVRITIKYENRIARVNNDIALREFFDRFGIHGANNLARHIRAVYLKRYGKPLEISDKSLAAEIYGHFKLQEATFAIERVIGKSKPTRWMARHMEVIDCGEREVDNNRFVWDFLSIFWINK